MTSEERNSIRIVGNPVGNRIFYELDVRGPWRNLFYLNGNDSWFGKVSGGTSDFTIEYDRDVSSVPQGIAIIPAVANVLPIAWLCDADIYVQEIDDAFYRCEPDLKAGYAGMYPKADFSGGRIVADRVVTYRLEKKAKEAIAFFSGGVDAQFTALSNRYLNLTLFTIWGADVFYSQTKQWETISAQNRKTAEDYGAKYSWAKSGFRLFLNYETLKPYCLPYGAVGWWHGFQHGIGLIAHAAPLAWVSGVDRVLIASSYSTIDPPTQSCASWPSIDNYLRFFDATVIHHDFSYSRQEKVRRITDISQSENLPVSLRVCWQSANPDNCMRCEKCLRTMFAVMAEGREPERYSLRCDPVTVSQLFHEDGIQFSNFWIEIGDMLKRNNRAALELPETSAMIASLGRYIERKKRREQALSAPPVKETT